MQSIYIDDDTKIVDSYWWETQSPQPDAAIASGDLSYDMTVIGAGFAGLACARRLTELNPDARIVLLEADRIGRSNSGRNSGFLLDLYFATNMSKANQAGFNRLQTAGLDTIRQLVEKHQIDCHWNEVGSLRGAISDFEVSAMGEFQQKYKSAGIAFENISADEVNSIMGTSKYRGGLRQGQTTLIHPSMLVCGLAKTLPANVDIFEKSPVIKTMREGTGHRLHLERGSISTKSLFLCCNGGVPALGYARSRQVLIATYAAVTPPLDASLGAISSVAEFGSLPLTLGGPTIRKTPDNRLLMREHMTFSPDRLPSIKDHHDFMTITRNSMKIRWPELADMPFEYSWHGIMPMTRNGGRIFGQFGKNLFVTAFCNGAANTSSTAAGILLAELSNGISSPLLKTQQNMPSASWVPPTWLLKPIVNQKIAVTERAWKNSYGSMVAEFNQANSVDL